MSDRSLYHQSPTAILTFIATIILTFIIGAIDWVLGIEIQFFVFYFIPITIAGVKCSPLNTYFIALLSGFGWLITDLLNGNAATNILYDIWNNAIRVSVFLIVGSFVIRIKVLLDREQELTKELNKTLSEVKILKGFLPVCAWCKKIRNDAGYWQQLEEYIGHNTDAQITHGMCQECADKIVKEEGLPPLNLQNRAVEVLTVT